MEPSPRQASVIPALVPVWVRSGFPVLAELGEQGGERPGMPGFPKFQVRPYYQGVRK